MIIVICELQQTFGKSMPSPMTIKDQVSLSKVLKARRKHLSVTQEDVASFNDMSRYTLVDMESGHGDPKLSTIMKILEGLGLSLVVVPTNVVERIHVPELQEDMDDDSDLSLDDVDFGENAR